jgi:hypothetical protein
MNLNKLARRLAAVLCIAACLGFAYSSALRAADSPPEMSPDGLRLQKNTGSRVIYVRPGVKFGQYDKVAILDCLVEFDKNWQSNYNSQQVDPSAFVGTDDPPIVERKKSILHADSWIYLKYTREGYHCG